MNTKIKQGILLSRSELKLIYGGVAQPISYSCTFTWTDGTKSTLTVEASNGNAAQCYADATCWDMNECTNVDCPAGSCD